MPQVVQAALEYDQLNGPNLASLEHVARELETIEYQYRERSRVASSGVAVGGAPTISVADSRHSCMPESPI